MARGAFWTIIVDDQPTAFRAPVREDLLPTLKQLHRQHPTAVIKWFQRGRLWETPGDAMDATKPPSRGVGWRPGGAHKDPRDQYKVPRDVKRARWASQAADGRGPWMKGDKPFNAERLPRRSPGAEAGRTTSSTGTGHRETGTGGRPPRADRPTGDRPAWKPKGDSATNDERLPRRSPEAEAGRTTSSTGTGHREPGTGGRPPRADRPTGDRPAWKPKGDSATNDERLPRRSPEAEAGRTTSSTGTGHREPGTGGRPPRADRPTGDRPAWKPKGDGPFAARGEKPAWRPREDRATNAERLPRRSPGAEAGRTTSSTGTGNREPGTVGRPPRADRPTGDRPTGERPAWKPKGDGPFAARGERPAWKPKADRATSAEGRPAWKPKGDRPAGDRPAWKPKGDGPPAVRGEKPAWKPKGDRPTGDRPAWKPKGDRPTGDRPAWKPKADGARPAKPGYRGTGTGGGDRPRSSASRGDWRGDRPGRDATPRPGGDPPAPAKKARTWRAGEVPPADRKRKKSDD
ncbi:hypothetical protein LuPra_06293 [Luteitalea pratensis]|uniref:Uncharacterized protein n=1 Tax=Luteitalea pratensis TaxID=1855912 RepID=A0A143PW76_LUTPR|nr:hypothetical protein LuPra_06293 [Luteitalea pratensis]